MLEQQAMPRFAPGTTWSPIVVIAHDPTEKAFCETTAFYESHTLTSQMSAAPIELFYMLEHDRREYTYG